MSVTAIAARKDHPADSRAALRAAVAAASEARDAGTKAASAVERAERLVAENQTKHASATKAVADAQTEDARRLASVLAAGGTSPTARATRQARTDEAEIADDLESARLALASLRVGLVETEREADAAGRAVDSALAEALKPVALLLIEKAREHHQKFVATSEALSVIVRLFTAWDGGDITKQANRVAVITDDDARVVAGIRREWEAALAALKLDASANLPPIEG